MYFDVTKIMINIKHPLFSSISTTDPPVEESFKILTEIDKKRRFKWDQASGQFSFSQEEEAHLHRAVKEMEEMCGQSPDTVAVLLRQYSGQTCSEVWFSQSQPNTNISEFVTLS